MPLQICKNLIFFSSKNPPFLYRSHLSFSFSLRFFSTSIKEQAKNADTVSNFLLHKHHFSPETASQLASVLARIKNLENSDSILLFLKDTGFSNTQLEKVVKCWPCLLSASLDNTIKPKIKIFQNLGFSANEVAEIISKDPWYLGCSAARIIPSYSVLKSLLGSRSEVAKVLRRHGRVLSHDLEKTMVPNIQFLESCGLGMDQIIKHLYKFPRFFLCSPNHMKKIVEKVDEIGICRSSKMFIHAAQFVSSISDELWDLKFKIFSNLGISEDDILKMFKKSPQVLGTSETKIRNVIEVLLATGKYDISCIVNDPLTFNCSLEKRIKPRLNVLGILDSRNLIEKWPSLATITRLPDDKFFQKFVCPFLNEAGEVYTEKGALNGKRDSKLLSSA